VRLWATTGAPMTGARPFGVFHRERPGPCHSNIERTTRTIEMSI
jgi:hypothetical protein